MKRTWKPTVAGILAIVAGIIAVAPGVAFVVSFIRGAGLFGAPSIALGIIAILGGSCALGRRMWGLALAGSISALFGCAGFLLIFGLLVVMFADMVPGLQPPWIFNNIFSADFLIDGSVISAILGILAIILVIMGKREFK